MIYSVTAEKVEYEQVYKVIVVATEPNEALALAKLEFDLAKEWVYPWENQRLLIEEINTNNKGVIATITS